MHPDKTIPCHTRYNHPHSTQPDTTTPHHTQQHTPHITHTTCNQIQPYHITQPTIPHHTTRYNQPTAYTAGTITYNIRQSDTTTPHHTTRYNHTHIQHKYIKPHHICTHHTIPLTCMAHTTKSDTALQTTHNHTHNKLQPLDTTHCIITHKTIQPHSCTRQPYPIQPDITITSPPHTHILQERGPDGVRPQTHILIRRRVKWGVKEVSLLKAQLFCIETQRPKVTLQIRAEGGAGGEGGGCKEEKEGITLGPLPPGARNQNSRPWKSRPGSPLH